MAKIYLIRHAESIANTKGIYQGQTYDTGLSSLGKQQAQAVGKRLANTHLDAIYASPLTRAMQTAQAVRQFQQQAIDVVPIDELKEISHGEWEGKPKNVIVQQWPELYSLWQQSPHKVVFPKGESLPVLRRRILSWFRRLQRRDGAYAVISHGGVIQTLLVHLHSMSLANYWNTPSPSSASITLIETHSPIRIIFENDVAHLTSLFSDLSVQAQ